MHGSWIKFFVDDTKEIGHDLDIENGQASWSKGCLDEIKQVNLSFGMRSTHLVVPNTEWFQFDRFICLLSPEGTHTPTRIARAVQAKITSEHLGKCLSHSKDSGHLFWVEVGEHEGKEDMSCIMISKRHVNRWLTIVIPYNDYPYMSFAPKGKLGSHAN